ncbi:SAM-dependent methyltransferase [uncultured Bacteroides sp.]|uniref:SAM-dependent methyltransferase n=1 Tax=uncultured Bacteroides sp. TaxID=162156 RepID=UPI002AAA6429|nr:SAM-dependent methyltransferase [uncultured Bacteroides sp.]
MEKTLGNYYPVSILGTGPGGPDYLTVEAKRRLNEADCILYDCLPATHILMEAGTHAEVRFIDKHPEGGVEAVDLLKIVEQLYYEGKKVVRLKAGDAMMFNGGGVDCARLKEMGIPFEVIPGLTAAAAATSIFAIPITEKFESNSIIYAIADHVTDNYAHFRDVSKLFKHGTTLALYMAYDHLKEIFNVFIEEGVPTDMPVVIASMISLSHEDCACGTIETVFDVIDKREMLAPFVFFIGKHVKILTR